MSILLSAFNIEKSFASRTLFRGLKFAIQGGSGAVDRIGLIGPNGAGKSTLLKIISGELKPDQGEVSPSRGLRIGFLKQNPEFSPNESVYQALVSVLEDPYDPVELVHVNSVLSKLDLNSERVGPDSLVSHLSGGWQKRVALARELARRPDLLLLDEPTNHLDIDGILWLEEFLSVSSISTVTITHDRLFLQKVANRIFDLDPRYAEGLMVVNGSYLHYLELRDEKLRSQEAREVTLKNTLRREIEWLNRGAKARTTKQRARIDRADTLKGEVEGLESRNQIKRLQLDFQEAERNPQTLLLAEGIGCVRGGKALFKDLDLLVTPRSRIGLLGANGCGKSTLIRCLLGYEEIDSGKIKRAEKLSVAYLEQYRDTLDPDQSVLRNLCPEGDYVQFRGQSIFARSYLDRFLFKSEQQDMPVSKLSGGEQARLRVAQLMLRPANILVLDEPTNDLDMATMAVLEEVLRDFLGAVILVSHDRFFIDQVCNEILAFEVDGLEEPQLLRFADLNQWEEWRAQRPKVEPKVDKPQKESGSLDTSRSSKRLSYNEKRELDRMETTILEAESELEMLQSEMNQPEIQSDAKRVAEIYTRMSEAQSRIDQLYRRWEELEQKMKQFS